MKQELNETKLEPETRNKKQDLNETKTIKYRKIKYYVLLIYNIL